MWPTPQEFNEAIQEPHLCFEDRDLVDSKVLLNPLGLPRSITGAFASVYQLSNRDRVFAVRCFLEERIGFVERYRIIEEFLSVNSGLGPFIDFKFVERGIRVKGRWYPILKMHWCDGVPLDQYINKHFKNHNKIVRMKEKFLELCQLLNQKGIAHGDLQHGNILVSGDNLFLVDYDGMYVPRLSGSESVELGHRNYQHPKRDNSHFSPNLDNFSSWIIHTSLEALSIDPKLWSRFDCGDDCLLFRHRDFRDPEKSEVLGELAIHESKEVREIGASIAKLLRIKPEAIPAVSDSFEVIEEVLKEHTNLVAQSSQSLLIDEEVVLASDKSLVLAKRPKKLVPQISLSRKFARKLVKFRDRAEMNLVSLIAPDYWAEKCLESGTQAYDLGNYGEAIKKYKQVAEIFRTKRGEHMWFFEANIRLGYSYLKTNQHGTASHYFRESEKYSTALNQLDLSMRSTLLLAATYFESGQAERSFDLITKSLKSTQLFGRIVRGERTGAFENSLTIPELLLNVGHIYLERDELDTAVFCFETTIEFCKWIQDELQEKKLRHLVRRALTGYCLSKFENSKEDVLPVFKKNMKSSSSLLRLIESEKSSKLSTQERYAEFLRLVAQSYYEEKKFKNSKIAYTASLTIHKKLSSPDSINVYIADCLLGIGKTQEAVNIFLDAFESKLNLEVDLVGKLDSIYEFHYAAIISALIANSGSFKDRNKSLNYLVSICPNGETLSLSLKYLNNSKLSNSKDLAVLLADCAKDLTRMGRSKCAQEIYSTSFKIFQRAGLVDQDADRVIECLLSNDDLDTAAQLLLDSSNLERTVRAIVSATVKGNNFQLDVITSILIKVLEQQMTLPYEHISDEELKVTLSLLKWCAEDDDIRVIVMEEKCSVWQRRRETTLAHSMIDQGKFGTAISIFEKFEGTNGPNVIQAYELWSMRYFTLALENREHSRLALVDGYALGCAIEIISTLKDKGGLNPDFALRVAELIGRSNPLGMEQHLGVLLEIFSSSGVEFEEAKDKIVGLLGGNYAIPLVSANEPSLKKENMSKYEDVFDASPNQSDDSSIAQLKMSNLSSGFSPNLREAALATKAKMDEKLWKALHRALFLVDRERYGEAVKALTEFEKLDKDNKFVVDANIAIGYCQYLLSNTRLAKAHFSRAVHESANDRVESYYRASVCLTQFALSMDLSKSNIRTLIDPSSQKKDIYRVGARLVNRTIELDSNLAICLADQLYSDAEEHEGLQHTSYALDKYEAALTIYGVKNKERIVEVIDCLDAIKQYDLAAKNLKQANMNSLLVEEEFHSLVTKLARRHVRTKDLNDVISNYESEGIDLAKYIIEVEKDLVIQKLTRILTSAIPPERYLAQLYRDIEMLNNVGNLDSSFAIKIAQFIENNIGNCSKERKKRLKKGLIDISVILQFVSEDSKEIIGSSLEEKKENED